MTDKLSELGDKVELAPIQKYLNDPDVAEIFINGYKDVFIRGRSSHWKLEKVKSEFTDFDAVYAMLSTLLKQFDTVIDEKHPFVNIRMNDGSRIFAVVSPVSLVGPSVVIRKMSTGILSMERLIDYGSLTVEMAEFIKACVVAKFNIIISGNVGSGKATLMNICSSFMSENDRIVTIERQAELQLRQPHVITLESRPPNSNGQGGISVKDLVLASPELMADYIVVDELEGEETLEVLRLADRGQAMLALFYANSPQDVLDRMEMLVRLDRPTMPVQYIRSLIGSAFNVIFQQDRMEDGTRKVTHISLVYSTGGECKIQDIFTFQRLGVEKGHVIGRFVSQPVTLEFYQQMSARGILPPPNLVPKGAN